MCMAGNLSSDCIILHDGPLLLFQNVSYLVRPTLAVSVGRHIRTVTLCPFYRASHFLKLKIRHTGQNVPFVIDSMNSNLDI